VIMFIYGHMISLCQSWIEGDAPLADEVQCIVLVLVASFPGLHCFRLHEKCREPGIFPHVCDVKGRTVLIEHGHTGAHAEQQEE